jgi:hypothetical protein
MADNSNSLVDWLVNIGLAKQLNNNDILSGNTLNLVMLKIIANHNFILNASNTAVNRINNWNNLMYLFFNLEKSCKKLAYELLKNKNRT